MRTDNCLNCGGVIMPPNVPMGYAGPVCLCPKDPKHQYQRPASKEPHYQMGNGSLELERLRERVKQLDVAKAILHEIMRTGTTQDGNTIEASLAYEALAFLAGERSVDDLKRIKALQANFEALGVEGEK